MPKYKDMDVVILRDATEKDPGYNPNEDMVVIRLPDGTEQTVLRNEVGGP